MPVKKFDPHDPFDMVVTPVPLEDGRDGLDEMARTIIQEYLIIGYGEKAICRMFRESKYTGPYSIFRQRGKKYIDGLVREETENYRVRLRNLIQQEQ